MSDSHFVEESYERRKKKIEEKEIQYNLSEILGQSEIRKIALC